MLKLLHLFCQNVQSYYPWFHSIVFADIYGTCQKSKNSNFKDSYLNIEKEFHYTVKDFFA